VLDDASVRDAMLAQQRARRGRWSTRNMVAGWLAVYDRLVTAPGRSAADARPTAVLDPRIGAPWS
jgi:hypothetical protein